jgi:serine/threonine protein kinase
MAKVFLGAKRLPHGLAQQVAIKELKAEAAEDHRMLAAFLGEARIALRLDHPNVVRCHEVITEPPNYYLVMEFLAGQSLLEIVRRLGWRGVPRDLHLWILTQLLAGLEHAHELADARGRPLGVVHSDVSPSNLIVGYDGQVKLLDFGIAKATGTLTTKSERPVRGKLGYIAPEQCLGEPADIRSDLYAVGVLLWEAIACRRRLSADSPSAIVRARIEDSEPPLEVTCPNAPPALLEITRRAIARLPAARYASARELRRDLELYLAGQSTKIGQAQARALMERHFARDRARLCELIEAHGLTSKSRFTEPPNAGLPAGDAVPARALLPNGLTDDTDEITSPIPVDNSLLILSKIDGSKAHEPDAPPQTTRPARIWRRLGPGALLAAVMVGLLLNLARPKVQAVPSTETATGSAPGLSVAALGAVGRAPPRTSPPWSGTLWSTSSA